MPAFECPGEVGMIRVPQCEGNFRHGLVRLVEQRPGAHQPGAVQKLPIGQPFPAKQPLEGLHAEPRHSGCTFDVGPPVDQSHI